MSNHLIIGLGGTGGKVIRELRKRIYEQFQSNEPGKEIHIEYIYADTVENLNNPNGWYIDGHDIQLNESQKVSIEGIPPCVFDEIEHYPELQFIFKDDELDTIKDMAPIIKDGFTKQCRRIGRWLFVYNLNQHNTINNFEKAVRNAVYKLQNKSAEYNVTFHICASLGGGFGSGALVDTIAQIRTWFPFLPGRPCFFKIRLLLHVPEQMMIQSQHDQGFYQANGYAALSELAAMSVNAYHPLDVIAPNPDQSRLLTNQKPFEACYLYNSINKDGSMTEFSALPKCAAEFLFQSLFNMLNTDHYESPDFDFGPETDPNGKPIHASQFFTLEFTPAKQPEIETSTLKEHPKDITTPKKILHQNASFRKEYEIAIQQNPLRQLRCLPVLKEKYNSLINSTNGKLNQMLLHTESFREGLSPLL